MSCEETKESLSTRALKPQRALLLVLGKHSMNDLLFVCYLQILLLEPLQVRQHLLLLLLTVLRLQRSLLFVLLHLLQDVPFSPGKEQSQSGPE